MVLYTPRKNLEKLNGQVLRKKQKDKFCYNISLLRPAFANENFSQNLIPVTLIYLLLKSALVTTCSMRGVVFSDQFLMTKTLKPNSNNHGRFHAEAVARRCSVKKVFLQITQNSQENTCARICFLIKLQA